jgi:serine/threonine-protein kinase
MIGTNLGKYEVLEEIGRGGMAVVFRGYDRTLDRDVAIKVLHPHLSRQVESKQRFRREARAVARLRFPNILEIYDYTGIDSDQAYIVTEFIHGMTLRRFFEDTPDVPTEVSALVALEIARGLRHAHQNDIIHRDIKPENIMIRRDGVVKITDFGIAQMAGSTQMTLTGQILGSPAHMSPEQVENKPLDFRADIFSLGTVLYWMVTGQLPFQGRNPHAVIKRLVEGDFTEPMRLRPGIGDQMARITRRCLATNPDDRYPEVSTFIADVEAFLTDLDLPVSGAELSRYFDQPAEYTERHRRKLVATLTHRGREEKRARRYPQALNYFNRVLAMDEANEEVLALIEAMTSRRRWRRVVEIAAVTLALVAAGWGLVGGLLTPSRVSSAGDGTAALVPLTPPRPTVPLDPLPTPDGAVSAVPVDAAAEPRAEVGAVKATPRPERESPRGGARGGARGAVRRQATRLVRIVPDPPTARVVIDGRDHGEYGRALAQGVALTVGSHRVRLIPENGTHEELRFQLFVPSDHPERELLVFDRSLPFRPALVRINTQAPGATVYVPHRARSRANRVFRVRLHQAEERVQMVVDADGFRSTVLDVVLQAGQEYSREVTLEPQGASTGQ